MSALASSFRAGSGRGGVSDSSKGSGRDGIICFRFKYLGQLPVLALSLKANHVCRYVPRLCWIAKTKRLAYGLRPGDVGLSPSRT